MTLVPKFKIGDIVEVIFFDTHYSPSAKPGMTGSVVTYDTLFDSLERKELYCGLDFIKEENRPYISSPYFVKESYLRLYSKPPPEGDDWI